MLAHRARQLGAGALLASAAAATIAMLAAGVAHADDTGSTADLLGWTVTVNHPNTFYDAVLSNPGNSLGLGTAPIAGQFDHTPLGEAFIGASSLDRFFDQPTMSIGGPSIFGVDLVAVQSGTPPFDPYTGALLVPALDGKGVVDLLQDHLFDNPPPLFNPDATGPIDIDGSELESPQDGALLNDVFDALFLGDTADWGQAATLFDDLLGIDPSGSTDAAGAAGLLPSFGL